MGSPSRSTHRTRAPRWGLSVTCRHIAALNGRLHLKGCIYVGPSDPLNGNEALLATMRSR